MTERLPSMPAYPASWVDRLQGLVERQPKPYWVYYLLAWGVLFGLAILDPWWGGIRFTPAVWVFISLVSWWPVFLLWGMHYLDLYALSAFEGLGPVLRADPATRARLKYQLTTLPAQLTLWVGIAYVLLDILINAREFRAPNNALELGRGLVHMSLQILGNLVSAAFVYHAIHQLSTIREVHAACQGLSPLRPYQLYGLTGLALRNTLIMIATAYILFFATSGQDRSELLVQVVIPISLLAGALFVAALWGVHQMLVREKQRLHSQAAEKLEGVLAELHQKIENKHFSEIDDINKAISGLQAELSILDKAPTWPWQADTPRWLLTAILLPLLVWLVQRILGKLGL